MTRKNAVLCKALKLSILYNGDHMAQMVGPDTNALMMPFLVTAIDPWRS